MTPTPSLNWTLPIYTVPDERNPVPVRCEVRPAATQGQVFVKLAEDAAVSPLDDWWLDGWWIYDASGFPVYGAPLPRLQNLPEETA